MKKLLSTFIVVFLVLSSYAQDNNDTLWRFKGITSLNFSQLSLTNWAAGGENSLAANGLLNLIADYQPADKKINWANELTLGFGLIRQGKDDPRKSDDKIDLASKFGYKASEKWYYSSLMSFKTQFTKGFTNPSDQNHISNFLAPGYINLSLGMDYKPSETFTMLIAPVTGKMTLVMDDDLAAVGAFGVEAGQNIRSEFGGYIKIAFSRKIMENVLVNTKIDFFSNYLDNPQHIDVNFDFILSLKVNEYISASFISQLIYDYDIKFDILDNTGDATGETESKIQFKELVGIGLTYSF